MPNPKFAISRSSLYANFGFDSTLSRPRQLFALAWQDYEGGLAVEEIKIGKISMLKIAVILVAMLTTLSALADNEPNITIRIMPATIAKPENPNYVTRCAIMGGINNDSSNTIETIEVKMQEQSNILTGTNAQTKTITDIPPHSRKLALLAGIFRDCKDIIDGIQTRVTTCRWNDEAAGDCQPFVKFLMLRGDPTGKPNP